MQEKIIRLTAVYTSIFFVLVMVAMAFYQIRKPQIQYVEASRQEQKQSSLQQTGQNTGVQGGRMMGTNIPVTENARQDKTFSLTLPEKLQNQDENTVSVTVDYVNKMVLLSLQNISKNELEDCQLMADPLVVVLQDVSVSSMADNNGGCIVQIPETDYESCQIELKKDEITLSFEPLKSSSECTVVVDAGHGGDDLGTTIGDLREKDITLSVIQQLQSLLEKENDMRIFYIRTNDTTSENADRAAFANAIKADMLISLHVNLVPAKENGLKAYYNDKFFIPEFGSIELANIMEEEVIQKIGGVATGLYPPDKENELVTTARVPVAELEIDSMCSDSDLEIMRTSVYQKQVAEGLYAGIKRAFEQINAE